MGRCTFCGRDAGHGSNKHLACENVIRDGKNWIISMIGAFVSNEREIHNLKYAVELVAKLSYIDDSLMHRLVLAGYKEAVDQALEDHVLSSGEEHALEALEKTFKLTEKELAESGAKMRVIRAQILRLISQGVTFEYPLEGINLPFILNRDETVVWLFDGVDYYEQQTRSRLRLGHSELSANTASLYLKASEITAEVESEDQLVRVDTGILAITTKNIYFAGSSKRGRIRYSNVISFVPYKSGIGVVQDGQSIDSQIFVTGDGWFTHNLASNLARRA